MSRQFESELPSGMWVLRSISSRRLTGLDPTPSRRKNDQEVAFFPGDLFVGAQRAAPWGAVGFPIPGTDRRAWLHAQA